jgi:hypothetical protein
MTWWRSGYGYTLEQMKLEALPTSQPRRLHVRKSEEKRILMLDGTINPDPNEKTAPLVVVEHHKKVGDGWVHMLCRNAAKHLGLSSEDDECYGCDEKATPYVVGMHTCIDIYGHESEGRKYPALRRLLAADPAMMKKLARICAEDCDGDMAGAVLRVKQNQDGFWTSPDEVEFVSKIALADWPEAQKKMQADLSRNPWRPFEFKAWLRMLSNQEMRMVWSGEPIPDVQTDREFKY